MLLKILDLETKRRDAILKAALKEFASRGFDEASTNIIAKEAGISKSLMFHYVNSKKDLFLLTYDYFTDIMNKEYLELMNFSQKDIFDWLYQSYLLQIELLKKYPCIFELNKLSIITSSDEINKELERRVKRKQSSCYDQIFDRVDESKFKEDLDLDICKQFILWSNIGFTKHILDDIRNSETTELDYASIIARLDDYFKELRKIFYK